MCKPKVKNVNIFWEKYFWKYVNAQFDKNTPIIKKNAAGVNPSL